MAVHSYGSIAPSREEQVGRIRKQVLMVGVLAAIAMSVVVVYSGALAGPGARTVLFQMDGDELHDAALTSLLDAPAMKARKIGVQAATDMLAAKRESQRIGQAKMDEAEAKEIADKDMAQLQSLAFSGYSGTGDSGEPLGLSTGNLASYDSLDALASIPKEMGAGLHNDYGDLSAVTATQLSGLKAELSELSSQKASIVNSLQVQRQQTASKMANDAAVADKIRLHRATSTISARQVRAAMRAAQMANQRAKEAKIIEQNQDAIAKLQLERVARLTAAKNAALQAASDAESQLRANEVVRRAKRSRRYHHAMSGYTSELQKSVAEDMQVLGQLRSAEKSAAVGPHVASSVYSQPPMGADLPEVDPALFMNDAPYRTEDSLQEFKQKAGTTQLSETAAGRPRGQMKLGVQSTAQQSPSILRVMHDANQELAELEKAKKVARRRSASQQALHEQVDRQLSELTAEAKEAGVNTASVAADASAALRRSGTGAGSLLALAEIDGGTDGRRRAAAAKAEGGQHFTEFPEASLASVRAAGGDAALLDDGALIAHAAAPVARMAIPLGAHQDASKGKAAVAAPKATIADQSTEASAVRADGSHTAAGAVRSLPDGARIRKHAQPHEPVHMPHVF